MARNYIVLAAILVMAMWIDSTPSHAADPVTLRVNQDVHSVAFSPNGKMLAVGGKKVRFNCGTLRPESNAPPLSWMTSRMEWSARGAQMGRRWLLIPWILG
jgi:hypothetical protein